MKGSLRRKIRKKQDRKRRYDFKLCGTGGGRASGRRGEIMSQKRTKKDKNAVDTKRK